MRCKNCGLEYPDDLTVCPGCGVPNEDVDAQPMSERERDSFEGITIEAREDDTYEGDASYRVYDQEDIYRQQKKAQRKKKLSFWWELVRGNLWTVAVLVTMLVLFIVLLPTLLGFLFIGIAAYVVIFILSQFLAGR